MKTTTKLITLLASVTLLTACGNTQKQEDTFTNSKEPQTEQTTQSTETTETSTEQEQNTQSQVGTTPAQQPTFEIIHTGMGHDAYGTLIDTYTVIHRPTGDMVYKVMNEEQAKEFCKYMEKIAHGKEKLNYSMTQNFELWCTNY